jgi:cytochrome P450
MSMYRSPDPKKRSIVGMWDLKDHTARRRTWEQAFTSKALAEFQPNVDALLEELIGHFDKAAKTGTPVDMALWSNLYSFDGESRGS